MEIKDNDGEREQQNKKRASTPFQLNLALLIWHPNFRRINWTLMLIECKKETITPKYNFCIDISTGCFLQSTNQIFYTENVWPLKWSRLQVIWSLKLKELKCQIIPRNVSRTHYFYEIWNFNLHIKLLKATYFWHVLPFHPHCSLTKTEVAGEREILLQITFRCNPKA